MPQMVIWTALSQIKHLNAKPITVLQIMWHGVNFALDRMPLIEIAAQMRLHYYRQK